MKPEDDDGIASGLLTLPNTYKSAWIIDGQHRIYGYAELEEHSSSTLLPFLAFENIGISDETRLFSDINSKQKRVEKRLLDEITGEIKLESADKREQIRAVASRVFDMMRDDDDGPLDHRRGGEAFRGEYSYNSLPRRRGDPVGRHGKGRPKGGQKYLSSRALYWTEPRDGIEALAQFMTEYLCLFQHAHPERWDAGRSGKFLTNPGAAGMIRFSADLIAFMARKENEDPRTLHPKILVERLEQYLQPVLTYLKNASDTEIENRFQIPFGSGGPRIPAPPPGACSWPVHGFRRARFSGRS